MFDGSLPEVDKLASLDDAALVDAAAGWARTENAACARKLAVIAEQFARRTGLPAGERELWWADPEAAVGAELAAAQNISTWMALAQAHRGVVLADRLPKVAALFAAGLINEPLVRTAEYRTDLVTDDEAIAVVDGLLADHVLAWGPLSVRKTEQAVDAIVDQVDPGALRRSRTTSCLVMCRSATLCPNADAPGPRTMREPENISEDDARIPRPNMGITPRSPIGLTAGGSPVHSVAVGAHSRRNRCMLPG